MIDAILTPDEARYAASLARAEKRESEKFPAGHSSRLVFEKSALVYRTIAEKLERQATAPDTRV